MLLASSGSRPRTPLNIIQCTGQLPTAKKYLAPNVISAKVEKPWSTEMSPQQTMEEENIDGFFFP